MRLRNDAVAALACLPLVELRLRGASLSPACFEAFGRMAHLRVLELDNTTLSEGQLRALRMQLKGVRLEP